MARLLEHDTKALLRKAGVAVPRSEVASAPDAAALAAGHLGGQVVVKALVPSNRRAKTGGVRLAESLEGAAEAASDILGSIFDGRVAKEVLVEEFVAIERELFLSLLVDTSRRRFIAVASLDGGVDFEETAGLAGSIQVVELDPWGPPDGALFRELWAGLGLQGPDLQATVAISVRAAGVFFQSDATVLELNPIALTAGEPRAVAVGAVIAVDDAALGRQPEIARVALAGSELWRAPTELELEALEVAATEAHRGTARFIELEGDIGLLCGGGGGSQILFESVRRAGGRPACFTEIGGNPSAEKVRRLAGIVLRTPGIRGLLVAHNLTSNTQVDLVATGVVEALAERGFDPREFPVVAREAGTHDDLGRAIFEEAGIEYLDEEHTLEGAARLIVERVRTSQGSVR